MAATHAIERKENLNSLVGLKSGWFKILFIIDLDGHRASNHQLRSVLKNYLSKPCVALGLEFGTSCKLSRKRRGVNVKKSGYGRSALPEIIQKIKIDSNSIGQRPVFFHVCPFNLVIKSLTSFL